MTQFYEGQEVEVCNGALLNQWRKAKIVARQDWEDEANCKRWLVQFPDGTRGVFDAEHIRGASLNFERLPQKETL